MNELAYKQLVNKRVRVRSNSSGDPFVTIGKEYILKSYQGSSMYKLMDMENTDGIYQNMPRMYYQDFDIIDNISNSEIKGFVKKKILPNEKDSFGIEAVLELKEDEETIYLSASTRNILEIKTGDRVGVAVDYDTKYVYFFKESEQDSGIIMEDDFTIKSLSIYADLVEYIGSKIVSINPTKINNPEYPDNIFYQVTKYNPSLKSKFNQMISLGNEVMNSAETSIEEIKQLLDIEEPIKKVVKKLKLKSTPDQLNYGKEEEEVVQINSKTAKNWMDKQISDSFSSYLLDKKIKVMEEESQQHKKQPLSVKDMVDLTGETEIGWGGILTEKQGNDFETEGPKINKEGPLYN